MKKICKQCRMFYDAVQCPGCKSNQTANVWQGRIVVLEPKKSKLAHKMNIEKEGDYAVKVR